jgi:hypothetical protein
VFLRSVRRLLVKASLVPSSPILVTLMKEVLSSTETLVLTRATRRNIPEDAVLYTVKCLGSLLRNQFLGILVDSRARVTCAPLWVGERPSSSVC